MRSVSNANVYIKVKARVMATGLLDNDLPVDTFPKLTTNFKIIP